MAYDAFISYSHAADGLLAPRLQAGLQRFAKPWWRRRAVRVFRDETSLSANPHLWASIEEALNQSGWFVLLLSPDAARSEWVNNEVVYWLQHKDPDRILPVLTDGDFGPDTLPPALTFADEPRWVDMRDLRGDESLDLKNPTFSAAIADIAATIRGVPKDDLESEEVRQHRRTRRTAWTAGLALLLLAVTAVGFGVTAARERDRAEELADAEADARGQAERLAQSEAEARASAEQAAAAEAEARQEAEANERLAEEQSALAEAQTSLAVQNERAARSEALAAHATAQLEIDPELAVLLAAHAVALDPRPAAVNALHAALQDHRTIFQIEVPEPSGLTAVGGLSPDGQLLAVAATFSDTLDVWDIDSGERLWSLSTRDDPLKILNAAFTPDGLHLVVLVIGDFNIGNPEPAELRVFNAHTGERQRVIEAPDCTGTKFFPGVKAPYYDISRPLVWVRDLDCDFFGTAASEVGMFDPATETFTPVLPIEALPLSIIGTPTSDVAGRLIAVDDVEGGGGIVVDAATGEVVHEYGGGMATLSADGTQLLARSDAENPFLELWDIETNTLLWRAGQDVADEPAPFVSRAWFSADHSLVYGTGFDGTVYVLDATTGFDVFELRGHGGIPREIVMSDDNRRLASFSADGSARVWDVEGRLVSEGVTYTAPDRSGGVFYGGAHLAGSAIALWEGGPDDSTSSEWQTVVVDPVTGDAVLTLSGGSAALSPDGALIAYREFDLTERVIGEVHVVDVSTGDLIVELDAPCNARLLDGATVAADGCEGKETHPEWTRGWTMTFSPDGRFLAMTDGADSTLTVWETEGWNVVLSDRVLGRAAEAMRFSPDGSLGLAIFGSAGAGQTLRTYDLDEFDLVVDNPLAGGITGLEFAPDGETLIASTFNGTIVHLSTSNLSVIEEIAAHQGQITDIALSPSGEFIVTTGEDGVRVWNLSGGNLVTDVGFDGDGISFARFLDDERLLLVPLRASSAIVVILDTTRLAAAARSKVTRSFTDVECATYDIDPCPTLADMRGS